MKDLIKLVHLFRPFWFWAVGGILLSTLSTLANITLLTTSAWFITAMGVAGLAGVSMNYFTPAALIRGCAIVRTGGRYLERLITHEATFRFLGQLRTKIFSDLAQNPLDKIEHFHSSDLANRAQLDIERLQGLYIKVLVPAIAGLLALIACLVFILRFQLQAGLVIGLFLLCAGLVIPVFALAMAHRSAKKNVLTAEEIKRKSVDYLDGLADLVSYQALDENSRSFNEAFDQRAQALRSANRADSLSKNLVWLLSQLGVLCVFVVCLPLLQTGQLNQPDFVLSVMFTLASFEAIAPIAPAMKLLPELVVSAQRILSFETEQATPKGGQCPALLPHATLEVKGLHFRHNGAQDIIKNLNFSLAPAQHLLLKGPSGTGKSTLADLLLGIRKPQQGQICMGKTNLVTLTQEHRLSLFSVATQDVDIFCGTLLENLRLGAPDATREDIERVINVCQLSKLIEKLEDGLYTPLGEQGYNLSGGQIRRVGLARALLKPAHIFILDEPSEGVDVLLEQRLMQAVSQYLKDKTLIVISHRDLAPELFDQTINLNSARLS